MAVGSSERNLRDIRLYLKPPFFGAVLISIVLQHSSKIQISEAASFEGKVRFDRPSRVGCLFWSRPEELVVPDFEGESAISDNTSLTCRLATLLVLWAYIEGLPRPT